MVEDTIVPEEGKLPETQKPGENEPKPLFSVDILRLIRDAQKQHGLRHGDFQRYRGNSICIFIFVSISALFWKISAR